MITPDFAPPTKKKEERQRLYGFWPHNLFPYFVGGEIRNVDRYGLWQWVGTHYTCRPTIILPYDEGVKLHKALDGLEADQKRAEKDLFNAYKDRLRALFLSFDLPIPEIK